MIEEQDVSLASLRAVFQDAFMDVTEIDKNGFKVKGVQFPFQLTVGIEPAHKLVTFVDFNLLYRIKEVDALFLCNEANRTLGPARFFTVQHDSGLLQVTHYQFTFERGLLPIHLITGFRTFEHCAGSAVRSIFKDYVRP